MRGGPAGQDLGRLDREGKENTLTRGWDTRRVKRCYPSKQTNKPIGDGAIQVCARLQAEPTLAPHPQSQTSTPRPSPRTLAPATCTSRGPLAKEVQTPQPRFKKGVCQKWRASWALTPPGTPQGTRLLPEQTADFLSLREQGPASPSFWRLGCPSKPLSSG